MKKKHNKKNHFIKFIFSIISFYCIWNIIFTQAQISKQTKILDQIKKDYYDQLDMNDEYKDLLSLESNDNYIKRIAREKLDFISPVDRVFVDISSK